MTILRQRDEPPSTDRQRSSRLCDPLPPARIRGGLPAVLVAVALGGCAVVPEAEVLTISGTYAGSGPAGEAIMLSLEQDAHAFRGQGSMAGQPVAIAGPLTWSALASVVHANGSVSLRRLSLDLDGETLLLDSGVGEPIALERTDGASRPPLGPFTGTFAGTMTRAGPMRATLVQSGEMLSGTGIVLGQAIGIGGRVVEPGRAEGIATFADESRTRFELELGGDGRTVRLLGLGEPITLRLQ